MDELYKGFFPNISGIATKKTSERDDLYNCIAWAFKDARRHWWPNKKRSYWPFDATGLSDMEAFEKWFSMDNWQEVDSINYEENAEKIALFTLERDDF